MVEVLTHSADSTAHASIKYSLFLVLKCTQGDWELDTGHEVYISYRTVDKKKEVTNYCAVEDIFCSSSAAGRAACFWAGYSLGVL